MRNSGKYLEDMAQKHLDRDDVPGVWIHRFMDSKSARNLGAKQPADFLFSVVGGSATLLECKSVKHDFRLPKFVQHSRMVRAGMAGMRGIILTHHWSIDKYRVVNIKDLKLGAPSHDLRKICPELDWEEAMRRLI